MLTYIATEKRHSYHIKYMLLLMGLVTISTSYPCYANKKNAQYSSDEIYSLGGFVQTSSSEYIGEEKKKSVLPVIGYENEYIKFSGSSIEYKWSKTDISSLRQVRLRPFIEYDFAGYSSSDSYIFDKMENRRGTLWGGVLAAFEISDYQFEGKLSHSITNEFSASSVGLQIEKTWQVNQFTLTPRLNIQYSTSEYFDYYYGVKEDEALSTRPEFEGDAGLISELGARLTYSMNKTNFLFADVSTKQLPSATEDSPLVDNTTKKIFSIGYIHRF
ncbi:hypothetical protein CSW98_05020 [Vibrio sp. HA2012]|uniref:MipA/OmpV family protein n=1 Tax=Vibrio sp. HA2012 TaxID=1971595 RepID=UPI000C2CC3E0|nr:MipA/OmpV family protein [Vibrio sp. HA2012]PJC87265.1 hypothetical protein CSW98_05020 [Vibrio sp. HA2012]